MVGQYPKKLPPCSPFQLQDTLLSHTKQKDKLVYAQAYPNLPNVPNIKK